LEVYVKKTSVSITEDLRNAIIRRSRTGTSAFSRALAEFAYEYIYSLETIKRYLARSFSTNECACIIEACDCTVLQSPFSHYVLPTITMKIADTALADKYGDVDERELIMKLEGLSQSQFDAVLDAVSIYFNEGASDPSLLFTLGSNDEKVLSPHFSKNRAGRPTADSMDDSPLGVPEVEVE